MAIEQEFLDITAADLAAIEAALEHGDTMLAQAIVERARQITTALVRDDEKKSK